MSRCYGWFAGLALLPVLASAAFGQARTYTENGVQYRETREKILRPMTEVRYEDRERTVYREVVDTQTREVQRIVHLPVTECQWEPVVMHPLGILGPRHIAYRLVPRTHLEARTEIVQRPIVSRRLVPEQRVERVPVVRRRMVEEEVIRRTAVLPTAPAGSHVTRRVDIGGQRLTSDPPRQGVWTRGRY